MGLAQKILLLFILQVIGSSLSAEKSLPFEFMHTWRTDGEKRALNVLKNSTNNKNVEWSDFSVADHLGGIRSAFIKRISEGIQPSAILWFGGTEVNQLVEEGILRVLPNQIEDLEIRQVIWPEIIEYISHENDNVIIPLGIHILNTAMYNNTILDELQASPARSWKEFMILAERATNAGYLPIALSDQKWQLRYILQSMLLEVLTGDEILEIQSGNWPPDINDKLKNIFENFRKLKNMAGKDIIDLEWFDASKKVVEGKALVQILGDYIHSEYPKEGFTCTMSPGNRTVLWGLDSVIFSKTRNEDEAKAQEIVAYEILQIQTQIDYIKEKGGLPVRKDIKKNNFSGCTVNAYKVWEGLDNSEPALKLFWRVEFEILNGIASRYWNDPNMSPSSAIDLMRAIFSDAL